MITPPPHQSKNAFTLVELMAVIVVIALLAAFLIPALVRAKAKARQMECVSNLKQIGLAFVTWRHDHDSDYFPAQTPIKTGGNKAPLGTGSASPFSNSSLERNKAYWQFAFLSNELRDPKVLVCPADRNVGATRITARTFGADPNLAGLMAPGYRDRACSYTVALDVSPNWWPPAGEGDLAAFTPLSTDRNIRWDAQTTVCETGVGTSQQVTAHTYRGDAGRAATVSWTNAIHGVEGNVLIEDGAVLDVDTKGLDAQADIGWDNGNLHFLVPD